MNRSHGKTHAQELCIVSSDSSPAEQSTSALRRAVAWVAALNLLYFGVEFAVAVTIGSVSLFADSIDFLEDASVSGLIILALAWRPEHRARVGFVLAGLLLVPGIATAWTAWQKFAVPIAPAPVPLSLAGLGALAINLVCAFMLARFRHPGGSLTRAAFLSARNDAAANVAIFVTSNQHSRGLQILHQHPVDHTVELERPAGVVRL